MAANTDPIFEAVKAIYAAQLTSADTTVAAVLGTTGSNGSRIDEIFCSTTDTTAVDLAFFINDGPTDHYIGVVPVPAGSGYATTPRVDAMATLSPVLKYLDVPAGCTLKAGCVATMTAAKTTDVVGMGGDY